MLQSFGGKSFLLKGLNFCLSWWNQRKLMVLNVLASTGLMRHKGLFVKSN